MAWIALHEDVKGPKRRKLAKALGCSKAEALGILADLWLWGLKNADKDGFLIEAEENDIEEAVAGETELPTSLIVAALFDTGWIDREDGRIKLHDWNQWQDLWYKAQERREADKTRKRDAKAKITERMANDEYAEEFEKFWEVYPRHVDKQLSFECYCTRRKSGWSKEQIMEATIKYASQCKHLGTQQNYIKHPKTFLGPHEPFAEFLERKVKVKEKEVDLSNPFEEYAEVS